MKLKYLYTGMLSLALMSTACTDDSDYPQPEPINPEVATGALDVYFYPASTTSYTIGEGDTELTVDVYRSNGDGAKTFSLSFESDKSSLFTVPANVSFADKEVKTTFKFNFDAVEFPPMEDVKLTFVVGEGENTPWAYQRLTYSLTYQPWEDVVGSDGEQYGTWFEDFLTLIYNVPEQYASWPVKIQSSPAVKGLYRIVNPYEQSLYFGPYDDDEKHYLYINAVNPDEVFFCDDKGEAVADKKPAIFDIGINFGGTVGYVSVLGLYNDVMSEEGATEADAKPYAGTLKNGVLTFPKESFIATGTGSLFDGGWYYTNADGAFKILWPGAKEEEDVWVPIGKGEYTDVLITPFINRDDASAPKSATWSVDVEQYKKDPNLYRMVNPYKYGVMPDGENYEGDKYLVFDATNPDCVYVKEQEILYVEDEEIGGPIEVMNYAYILGLNGLDDDQIITKGFNDTFENNVFTFKPEDLMLYMPNTTVEDWKGQVMSFNDTDEGKLVLSDDAAETASVNRRKAIGKVTLSASQEKFLRTDIEKNVYKGNRNF